MPLYLTKTGLGEAIVERLIEANNKAVARNFVARDMVAVELAGQADLFRLAKAGKEVEVAKDLPEVSDNGGASGGGVEPAQEPEAELQPEAPKPPVEEEPEVPPAKPKK